MAEASKAVLITGCSSGIGRATAERLAAGGWLRRDGGRLDRGCRRAEDPYADFNAAVGAATAGAYEGPLARLGGGPETVARAIERAISARQPKTRYKVTPLGAADPGAAAAASRPRLGCRPEDAVPDAGKLERHRAGMEVTPTALGPSRTPNCCLRPGAVRETGRSMFAGATGGIPVARGWISDRGYPFSRNRATGARTGGTVEPRAGEETMEAGELREQPAAVGASAELAEIDPTAIAARTPWELFWRRFREDKLAMASLVFLALLVLIAIFAPLVVKIFGAPGPNTRDTDALDIFGTATGPSSAHIFGVDQIGRDVFSRTIYGARVSLIVAVAATGLATVAGVIAGLLAGYFRGWIDTVVSRSVDVLLAIPYLLLAVGLAAACTLGGAGCLGGLIKPGLGVVIVVIAFTSWTYMARIIRGQTLSLREKEFIEAARSVGASHTRIIFKELLPNLVAPIVVYASILVPQVILYEAALSFLGVGVQPPTASWGQMISDATPIFSEAPWYMLFPGIALLLTVLAFNLVGDAMQDALNPRAKKT